MNKPYTILSSAAFLLLTLGASAQGPKPGMHGVPGVAHSRGGGAPANDECAGAIVITVGATCTTTAGSTLDATETLAAAGDCGPFTSEFANDVWYSFVATSAYTVVDVTGIGDFDAILQVFGGTCAAPEALGCADENYPVDPFTENMTESIEVATTVGSTYYVRAYRYQYTDEPAVASSDFTICAYQGEGPPPPPANDECEGAIVLTVGTACNAIEGSTLSATESLPASECSDFTAESALDVWFSFTATSAATTIDVINGETFDAVVEYFSGDCGALVSEGCVDAGSPEHLFATTTIGTTYYVRVYDYSPDEEAGDFSICAYETPAPPANDECADAVDQALAMGATITFTGDNTGATEDVSVETVLVWHSFTTTECADVTLNYCVAGSEFTGFLINLVTDCADPLNGLLTGDATACDVIFYQLPAGTYLIPVLVEDGSTPIGAYSLTATASACDSYCAGYSEGCDEFIATLTFGTLNNSSECGPTYGDYTDQTTVVMREENMPISVMNNPEAFYEADQCAAWFDWNQNNSFEDAGEMYPLTSADLGATFTGTVAVPADATLGATRMRVRMMYTGDVLACGMATYGDVEDYMVDVHEAVGIVERMAGNWAIFPNPSNGSFTISGVQLSGPVAVEVRDMTGRLVYTTNRTLQANVPVNVDLAGELATGTYHLALVTPEGRTVRPVMVH